jgi:hypothetical protein
MIASPAPAPPAYPVPISARSPRRESGGSVPEAEQAVVRLEHRFDGSARALDGVEEAACQEAGAGEDQEPEEDRMAPSLRDR